MASVAATASTSGSASYITSISSGLDTDALIDAAVAQKTARADTIDAKVTENTTKISAYQEVQTLVAAVSDAMESLALPAWSSLGSENAFDNRSGSLTTASGAAVSGLAVDVDSEAATGIYSIEVVQLAQAMKVAATAAPSTTALGLAGVMSVGVEGGTAANITVAATTTLSDLAKAINAQTSTTGVQASLVKLDDTNYQLVLSAVDTNETIVLGTVSGDDVARSVGLTDADGGFTNVLREAQPAIITVDGATVTRSTNEMTDVIDGVSFSLAGVTTEAVTLTITADNSGVKTAISDFVTAYNALKQYVLDQQAVSSSGGASDDAVLFADSLLRSLDQTLKTLINGASASSSGDISRLSDIGITWTSDNLLEISDETALNDAILSNAKALESFFETDFTASDSGLKLLRNNTSRSLDFTLSITIDESGAITGVTADGDDAAFTISGSRVVGATGTAYEGITFILAPASSGDISVSIQQGFANLLTQAMTLYDSSTTSLIQQRIDSIETVNEDLTTRSDKIRTDADAYREKLVTKYANMEAELTQAKLLQAQIAAILGNTDDDE
ncbi:flagellar filament capping protein FliD [Brevundimonas goettingensis]|uniref:Flagellar hook-associated protein 2 n=1 Tax=Brevundimonas goettingensis TaxID=2774190 RepID=A0A975C091_9CAUL|nr:flagellar filament capping protein FliD [Brevundimonas goettingensis]QTC89929.1 flagellar filament capping protein FliD [Brevundimonas goettingensis]